MRSTHILTASLILSLAAASAAAIPATEELLPDTTAGFLSITKVADLSEHWGKTQIGQLMKQEVMKPFVEDMRKQFDERWSSVQDRLGLTMQDLRDVPTGEVGVAAIHLAPGKDVKAVNVILADIRGNRPKAEAVLKRITEQMAKRNAATRRVAVGDVSLLVFDVPPSTSKSGDELPGHQTIYFLTDTWIGAGDDLGVIQGIVTRVSAAAAKPQAAAAPAAAPTAAAPGGSLASLPAFTAVMTRCQADAAADVPQVRWFIDPFRYMETVRAAQSEPHRRKGRTMVDIFRNTGFTAITGIGGRIDFAVHDLEIVHRTAVFAPKPWTESMNMMSFLNQADAQFTPQDWIPREVASYCSFFADVQNAFDNFGPLFDETYGEGKRGAWKDVLMGLERDPHGPKINLREEIVAHLGKRVTILTDYQLPITTTSERLIFAVEATDEAKAAAGVAKLYKNDKEMRRKEFEGHVIWESVPPETGDVPVIEIDSLPLDGTFAPAPVATKKEESLMPNQAITVAKGQLLIASHYDFLVKVLTKIDQRQRLARNADYQLIAETTKKFGLGDQAVQRFSRTDEEIRPTYELIRQGKMPESETMLGKMLNAVMGAGKKGAVRKQEIRGDKMPDFEIVRRSLGPGALSVVAEEKGWFIKGALLKKGE